MWLSIVGQIALGLIALASLCKDWSNYSTMSKRLGKLVPFFLLGLIALITFFPIWHTMDSAKQAAKDSGRIEELLNKIKDLQGQVKATKASIEKPLEKANLVVTFSKYPTRTPMPNQPLIHKVNVTKQMDGTVDLIIYILNKSKVQAKKCTIFIRICKECTFNKEPENFSKATGASDDERFHFYEMHAAETALPVSLNIRLPNYAPLRVSAFQVDVTTRCENCIANPKSTLTVSIQQ